MPPRFAHLLAMIVVLAGIVCAPRPARGQTHDPRLVWRTLETRHFRVHYYDGLREVAQHVASVGEGIYGRIGSMMGWHPSQVTEVVLTDNTDDANGSANAVPYNTVRLYVTAPDDASPLGEYDDWMQTLVTHEFTHIAHSDNISGLPAVINAILGKVYPPNQVQPRWVLEGVAVYSETKNTTGGRLRSSLWDMYMRADALENRFVTLDQLSTGPNRWPHGNIWYLYGSYFVDYLVHRFGERVLAEMATYYGRQLVPYALNRAMQRATGLTYEQLYPQFLQAMRERYVRQRAAIEARGVLEGERLTRQGEFVAYPRFLPDGHTVAYESGDGRSHLQIRTIDAGRSGGPRALPHNGDYIAAADGFAFNRDGTRMILSDVGFWRDIYFYRDLYERPSRLVRGALEMGDRRVMTEGARAMYPDLSPDDDHVAFSVNHHGTLSLFEMSLRDPRPVPLLRVRRFEQIYTPRYSPDGRLVAFSHWQRGGFRDIRILDKTTGAIRDVTHDRAMDTNPVFSPDGRYVLFASDRTGVANIYAYELATSRLFQVTNVVMGASMPTLSPDGRVLVYRGYSSRGYDLYRMPFDPWRWLDPLPAPERVGQTIATPPVPGRTYPYDPWPTLRPRTWSLGLDSDGLGPRLAFITGGADVVGNHSYGARLSLGFARGDPGFDVTYSYAGMRPTFRLHAYRTVDANRWRVGQSNPAFPLQRWGGEAVISADFPQFFGSNSLAFSYEAQYSAPLDGLPFGSFIDPSEPASVPPSRGWTSGIRGSWSHSRVRRYTYDISSSEGYETFLSVRATDPVFGSSTSSFDVSGAGAVYVAMPWGYSRRPHVLAVRLAGGLSTGDQTRPIFSVGGFPTYGVTDFITAIATLSSSSGVALRGYAPFARRGNAFVLGNVEYRVPIWQIDRGPATLPVYLSRLYGTAFVDVGHAFTGTLRFQDLAVGAGAELLFDVVFGYVLSYTVRLGVAQGFTGPDATLQGYALFSAPF